MERAWREFHVPKTLIMFSIIGRKVVFVANAGHMGKIRPQRWTWAGLTSFYDDFE